MLSCERGAWMRNVITAAQRILRNLLAVFRAPTVCPGSLDCPGSCSPAMKPLPSARPPGPRRLLPARVRLSLGAVVGFGFLLPSSLSSAEAARRTFDIPAGDAATTLKHFATQSSEQLLYSPDDVNGVQTQAVRGEFSSFAALTHMLQRTPLKARQDERTNAISITVSPPSRAPPSPAHPQSPPSTSQTSPSTSQSPPPRASDSPPMKKRSVFSFLASLLTLGLSGTAQIPGQNDTLAPGTSKPVTAHPQNTGSIFGRVQNVVTAKYLNNARVSVKGTNLTVLTDEFGAYRLVNVPSGPIVLEVFYTDLDRQEIPLNVPPSDGIEQNVDLTSMARYGQNLEAVKLDPFVVTSNKETDAQAIAINEQRFAPNITNVIATDSLGDVLGSNVGEFLKFMPGLVAEYSGGEIVRMSIRGIGTGMTSFSVNGSMVVSTNSGTNRDFDMNSLALNDISRIEVTKVPTPSTPADSLAGSVNMIGKSAFERSRAELRYGVNVVGNSENLTLKKTPHSNGDRNTHKVLVGADFDYTLPVSKDFGIVLTGMQSNKFNEQHLSTMAYNSAGTGTGASVSQPYLQQHTLQDGPRSQTRNTLSLKADWRITPKSVLSFGGQWNEYKVYIGTLNWVSSAGTVATPTPGTGVPFSYGPYYTIGATGRGAVNMSGTGQSFEGGMTAANLSYRFDDGTWKVEAGVNQSNSDRYRSNVAKGHFASLNATLIKPVRVTLSDVNPNFPGSIRAYDSSNTEVDLYDINNYRISGASETPYDNKAGFRSGKFSARRQIDSSPFPTSLQIGGQHSVRTLDVRSETQSWTYNGPDGNPNTVESAAPQRMQVYVNQDSHYGFKNVPWISANRAWSAFQSNPILFSETPAQLVARESSRLTASEYIEESVSALYVQAEANLFKRLNVLTGVRFEKTVDKGQGSYFDPTAVFLRTPNGVLARDTAGKRIRRPEAGAVGSMEELRVVRKERAALANRSYEGYYPSLHLTYDLRENFLVRAAYAKTYGRPNFTNIIPRTVVSERDLTEAELEDPSILRGTLTVRNTGLRPWTADNYDVSLEYYTEQGGLFSAGVFLKEIKDFFGASVRLATLADLETVGLDPRYVGWNLSTTFNSGDARISGAEFNVRHSLRQLGGWGRFFSVFANATKLKLEGDQQASFDSFIPESGNWGFSFSRRLVGVTLRWNYRGLDKRIAQPLFGADGFEYIKARTTLDLNLAYQLSRRLSLVGSVNNVLNASETWLRYGSETPDYARQVRTTEYGVALAIGLKGVF
jgi:TonB-dependent receptor